MAVTLPIPTPEESHERFVIRAHRELSPSIPDPERRNRVVWTQWRRYRGHTDEERRAAAAFDPQRYVQQPNVCVFAEHSAIDGQGRPRKYGVAELARIVRTQNGRIADFDGFVPIADGHTANPDDPFRQEPDILGYAGPYRLGMIGRKNPRWAIFTDEWHMREAADRLARKPRRSVELWTFAHDPTRMHFDPIAAIGAETPRLSLPIKFRREQRDGVVIERYTFSAPAFVSPGASNTFVKRFSKGTRMLTNEDISQLMAAFAETPQFKFLDEMMKQKSAGGGQAATQYAEKDEDGDDDEEPEPGEQLPPEAGDDDLADLNDLIVGEDDAVMAGKKKPLPVKNTRAASGGLAVKYSRLESAHNRLVQEHGRMAAQVLVLHRGKTDAERAAVIQGLARQYPDFIDVDTEMGACLYSRNANMGDEAFQAHMASVEKYAQRADMVARSRRVDLPMGELDRRGSDAETQKYEAALAAEAVKIHTAAVNAGKPGYTWSEAMDEAKKSLKP